jgi:hypothetical protein
MAHQTVTAIDTRLSTVETVVAIEREENHVQTDFDCFVPGIYFGRPVPCALCPPTRITIGIVGPIMNQ